IRLSERAVLSKEALLSLSSVLPIQTQRDHDNLQRIAVGGLLSLDQVCKLYKLDAKEFLSWQYCIERYGFPGLRATRVQYYITSPEKLRRSRRRTLVGT